MEKTSQSKLTAFEEKIEDNTRKTIENLVLSTDRIKSIEEKKVSNLLTQSTSKEALELAKNRICELLENNPEMHFGKIGKKRLYTIDFITNETDAIQ